MSGQTEKPLLGSQANGVTSSSRVVNNMDEPARYGYTKQEGPIMIKTAQNCLAAARLPTVALCPESMILSRALDRRSLAATIIGP